MHPISENTKLILGLIAGSAATLVAIFSIVLEPNLRYTFRQLFAKSKGGKRPSKKSPFLWIAYIVTAIVSITAAAIAGSAPSIEKTTITIDKPIVVVPTVVISFPITAAQIPTSEILIPTSYKIDKSDFAIFDQNNNILWEKEILGGITKIQIEDLEGDGLPEVVTGVYDSGDYFQQPIHDCGKLIVFDNQGNIKWEINFNDFASYAVNVGGKTGKVVVSAFIIGDLDGNEKQEIIVATHDLMWYPSKLSIVSFDGKVGGEFWHPGFIYELVTAMDRENGRTYIVGRADNNDLSVQYNVNPSVLFALDPLKINGQAPPYKFFGIEHGKHLWYGIVEKPAGIEQIQVREMVSGPDVIVAKLNTGHYFYINSVTGEVQSVVADDGGVNEYPPDFSYFP